MKWRLLVVDDEPDVRLIVRTTLEQKYEVLEAHDGLDALEKIERYEPDFVLMDVMMPLMNGFEACMAIRKNAQYQDLPVMFLSALGSKEDIMKGYASGANLYLTKPFDPPRLLKNVDLFFEKSPPPSKTRRHTIEQIREAEQAGKPPVAPGARDFDFASMETRYDIETAPSLEPSKDAAPKPGDPLPRIMAVDDNHEIIDLIRLTFMNHCEVVGAKDGMEAIEKLVKYQPDILVIDIMLPKMNGFQLVQSLRSNKAFARMPIMMCSAKAGERDINFAKRVGANDYLVKPFQPQDLVTKIKALQALPGFRVRPKTYSIHQINAIESPSSEKDVFELDQETRQRDAANKSRAAMQRLIQKEGGKEALDAEEDKKKKRRFFGFGGKE